ncbi:hypothetical protein V5799_012135 [Amblyomma americanum]|uniref:Uncharacterized protein n=1 Tax=Amblyomma americanum TaxID=6943 RepID=A0AAQ4EFB4_AMBAM
MPFAKFFWRTENEAANIEAVVSTDSTTTSSSFNFKRKIRNMSTRILVIPRVGLAWVKPLMSVPNFFTQLFSEEYIIPQEIIDTADKTDGSGDNDLDYQNDHKDQDDLHKFNDLDDLGSEDEQDDLDDLGDLEGLD